MKRKFVYIQKTIKISEIQQKKLDEIMESGSYSVEADVFRQGLDLVYRKVKPAYLEDSPNMEIKREKIEKERAFKAIPDEEFAKEHVEGSYIYTDTNGKKWLFFRRIGNEIQPIALDQVKDWVANDPAYLFHKQNWKDASMPYEHFFTHPNEKISRQWYKEEFGVAMPDEVE